jgi:hypothetical protein
VIDNGLPRLASSRKCWWQEHRSSAARQAGDHQRQVTLLGWLTLTKLAQNG